MPSESLRQWWGSNRGRALKALSELLGIDREALLSRLGVANEGELAFPRPNTFSDDPKPERRRRGRPRRELDPFEVRKALQRHKGNVRAVARHLNVPRATLARFIDREVRDLDRIEKLARRQMRNSQGKVRPLEAAMVGLSAMASMYSAEDFPRVKAIMLREYEKRARKGGAKVIPLRPKNAEVE